jgi:hypothetical protein
MRQYRVTLTFAATNWIAIEPYREKVTASTAAAAALDVLARWTAGASELRQHTLATVIVNEVAGRPQMVAARAASPKARRRG